MAVPKDIRQLFVFVARSRIQEAEQQLARRRSLELEAEAEHKRSVDDDAFGEANSEAVFVFARSAVAEELRVLARRFGVKYLPILFGVWPSGERRGGYPKGSWQVCLEPTGLALRVRHVIGFPGGVLEHRVHSAAELREALPPRVLRRLAAEIESGEVWSYIRESLTSTATESSE